MDYDQIVVAELCIFMYLLGLKFVFTLIFFAVFNCVFMDFSVSFRNNLKQGVMLRLERGF